MDLYDFRFDMCDDSCYIRVFDLNAEECIYNGPANEMPEELESKTVLSFDLLASENP